MKVDPPSLPLRIAWASNLEGRLDSFKAWAAVSFRSRYVTIWVLACSRQLIL